ncbi:MAG: VCBS repeat-containing protein [Planctomycetes bacterium]|nr:VCBS repeat-containing protein [Planctomycetota bacterium]
MRSHACAVAAFCSFLVWMPAATVRCQDPALHAAKVVLPADGAPFQRLFDADGDGDPDAVGTRVRSDGLVEVRVWRNDGGAFTLVTTATHLVPAACCYGRPITGNVEVGDLDRDGDVDVVVGAGDVVMTLANDGNFQFALTPRSHPARVVDLAIADFDGDGGADLAVWASVSSPPGAVNLQVETATATLSTQALYFPRGGDRLFAVQADADPAMELGVGSNDRVQVFEVANGALVEAATLNDGSIVAGQVVLWMAGDVDRDGDDDIVGFEMIGFNGPAQPRVHTFRATGAMSWQLEPYYSGGPAEYLQDIDGDGDLDGVCCGGGSGGNNPVWPTFAFASTFEIAPNDGTGRFPLAHDFPGFGSQSLAGVADVDGDGHLDLVAGLCVFSGNGTWGRQPMPRVTGHNLERIHAESVFDRDGDGDPDVGSAVLGGSRNLGDGTFAATTPLTPPSGTYLFGGGFVGDFDGDGTVDEIVHSYSLSPLGAFAGMTFWRNNGSGVLTPGPAPCAAGLRMGYGFRPEMSDVADLDGDGDLDLIGNSDPRIEQRHWEIFWNDGTGFFTQGPVFGAERFEGAADLDGDGILDLVTSVDQTGDLMFRRGTGNSASPFAMPAALFPGTALGLAAESVNLVDANADGRIDVLAVAGDGMLHLHENVTAAGGPAAFALSNPFFFPRVDPVVTLLSAPVQRVEVIDLDRDGLPDLVAGPSGAGGHVIVLRRLAAGTSSLAATNYAFPEVYTAPMGFARDADGDGDLDLVGTRVVDNRAADEPRAGQRQQYGVATAGEAGVQPLLGATGPFVAGGWKHLHLTGVTGPTAALLVIGLVPASLPSFPLPGVTLLVDPAFLSVAWVPIVENGGGRAAASARFSIYLPPSILGLTFFDQMLVLDPAGPSGVSASNGLRIRIGG